MVHKPVPPPIIHPDHNFRLDGRRQKDWSSSTKERRVMSEKLGAPLEVWLRARITEGYSDRQLHEMLYDITEVKLHPKTVHRWRLMLGYRLVTKIPFTETVQGPAPHPKNPINRIKKMRPKDYEFVTDDTDDREHHPWHTDSKPVEPVEEYGPEYGL